MYKLSTIPNTLVSHLLKAHKLNFVRLSTRTLRLKKSVDKSAWQLRSTRGHN
ncbi:uncharacterized protein PHALS_04996 [Plasmopara halstedii]|uniref:Uncharacterized protein n=1 Tax=Plasmopara halstedii TaxID=4781 RepID=A0A0P1AAM5_PLAHL|nr:uncharacterized protein PHALS_04996 [Plasmopara halstedii]CEG37402.1 hypothetical protein PHALS_04996 [Plasmopara halstedii]|eukprot:XP_024573771.1 hypothetical protein PHALS_04996 [Plasmopara halstedii]